MNTNLQRGYYSPTRSIIPSIVYTSICIALAASLAKAAVFSIPIEKTDQDIFVDGSSTYIGNTYERVGRGYTGETASVYVLPFKLPALPAGERIVAANLSVNIETWSNWDTTLRNVDLYGIGIFSNSNAANYPEYFVDGTNPITNQNAVALHSNWITPSDIVGYSGAGQTIPKKSQDIAWFIQALYDAGGQPGEYGFLSLAHDAALSTQRYYGITSANSTTLPTPVITITTGTAGKAYYIDGSNGSDSGIGSALSPWKTFNHAQAQLQPGDTVFCTGELGIVKMCTTTGTAGELPYKLGTADTPITYKAWSGKTQPHVTRLVFDGVQKDTYLTFDGILFSRGEIDTADTVDSPAVYLPGASHVTFNNCDIVGAQVHIPAGVINPNVSPRPYSPDSYGALSAGTPANASYVTVQGCRIRGGGCGIEITENEAYSTKQARYWQILGNDISNAPEDGIRASGGDAGAGSIVRYNYIHDQNVYTCPLIYNGFAYGADGNRDATAFNGQQWALLIQNITGKTAILFYTRQLDTNGWTRFFILANDNNNLPATFSPYGWKLASNPNIHFEPYLQDGVTPGAGDNCHPDCLSIMGQMTGALIEKNAFNVGKYAGQSLKIQNIPYYSSPRPPTNITFQNNLFYSTTNTPASGFLLNIAGGKNCTFLHNTIYGGTSSSIGAGIRFVDMFGTGFQGIYFYNNIITGGAPSNTSGTNLAISDYNLWMSAPTATIQRGSHDVILTGLNAATAATAVKFVNPTNGDLRINAGAPAQNMGVLSSGSLSLPPDDINGYPRGNTTSDRPDAGAYEVGDPAP